MTAVALEISCAVCSVEYLSHQNQNRSKVNSHTNFFYMTLYVVSPSHFCSCCSGLVSKLTRTLIHTLWDMIIVLGGTLYLKYSFFFAYDSTC